MAYDLARLEQALVNADKAGDTEAAKAFAAEIRRMRSAVSQEKYDPTEGMSGWDKFMAGMGKAFVDIGRGAGQLTGLVDQEDINEAKRRDAALMNTGAGLAGNISGNVAAFLPTAMIPGASTLAGAGLTGAGIGMLQPVAEDESRLKNVIMGGAGGVAGNVAGRGLAAGLKGAKALVEPFYRKGQQNIASRTLGAFAGNADDAMRNMSGAREIIPGSLPTAAESAKDAGIAQLQRTLANTNPQLADDLMQRALDQNAARMSALQGVTGSSDDLASALAARSATGKDLYSKAFSSSVRVDGALKDLTSRPSMKSAIQIAKKMALEEGQPLGNLFDKSGKFASVKGLHYVKMALDDMIDNPASGLGRTQQKILGETRSALNKWLSSASPEYAAAKEAFSAASGPVNRLQVGQEILKRTTGNQLPNVRGDMTLYPSAFGNTMKAGDKITSGVTGMKKGLSDVMSPEQMATLGALKDDLARSVVGRDMGRAVGSNTGQNMASANILRQILGPMGMPEKWAESTLLQSAMRPISWATKIGEEGIREEMAKAILNPQYAAQLMGRTTSSHSAQALARYLSEIATISGAQARLPN